jgi:NAD(P) transhydrogenase subunit alpha
MDAEILKQRTKQFAIRNIKLFKALPNNDESKIIGKQLLRSATSVAANYRAVCRARSDAEFHSKLSIVVEEIDECCFWMELLIEAEIVEKSKLQSLNDEANEILLIMAKSRNTIKNKLRTAKIKIMLEFINENIQLFYLIILMVFVGIELIGHVPSVLHTPLMSGANAIHGVVIIGSIIVMGQATHMVSLILGFLAVVLGTLNVVGGFVVTDRMLEMFKKKK